MSWCPKCGYEYREGFDKCKVCNVELVDKNDSLISSTDEEDSFDETAEWKLLIKAKHLIEADVIEGLLSSEGIVHTRRYKGIDQYLKVVGIGTMQGIEIYVPDVEWERAVELVNSENMI